MLVDRIVLVTNVTAFLGLPAAAELTAQGATVMCHDASFRDETARHAFEEMHAGLRTARSQAPADVAAEVLDLHGRIDVLVNNDAFPAIRAPVDEARLADLSATLQALVAAPFALTGAVVPSMKRGREGKVIFITSAAPLRGLPNYSMYVTARGAANALAVSLAKELAPFNIQVNAMAPNYVESPTYFPPQLLNDPEAMRRITRNIPLGRLGKPDEAAALIAFLASSRSDFITGQVLPFAGGWA